MEEQMLDGSIDKETTTLNSVKVIIKVCLFTQICHLDITSYVQSCHVFPGEA